MRLMTLIYKDPENVVHSVSPIHIEGTKAVIHVKPEDIQFGFPKELKENPFKDRKVSPMVGIASFCILDQTDRLEEITDFDGGVVLPEKSQDPTKDLLLEQFHALVPEACRRVFPKCAAGSK